MADTLEKKEAEMTEGVERTRAARVYTPAVDIIVKDKEVLVTADMPGVDDKSIDITLEKNVLTIYGKVDVGVPEKYRATYVEYGVGDYSRSFTLSEEVDRQRIEATVKNGVLKLILPMAEAAKTKKIEVKAA
ncbi:MAG: Hsp20/alpha crystallin family protein [Candidatus Magnetominusculus sp. LBB02]|nr:Hsp20/alpha crystallin family protein [Candidatus Magnetominusculus sp. LBB02]